MTLIEISDFIKDLIRRGAYSKREIIQEVMVEYGYSYSKSYYIVNKQFKEQGRL